MPGQAKDFGNWSSEMTHASLQGFSTSHVSPWARGKADASQIAPCKSQTDMPLRAFLESRQGRGARAVPARCKAASEACQQTTKQVKGITSCLCKHQKMLHTTEKERGPIPFLNTELQPLDRFLPCFSLVSTSPWTRFYVLMGCPGFQLPLPLKRDTLWRKISEVSFIQWMYPHKLSLF